VVGGEASAMVVERAPAQARPLFALSRGEAHSMPALFHSRLSFGAGFELYAVLKVPYLVE